MPIHYVEGDIWVNRFNCDAIAHGVNLQGVMNAGVALTAKRLYPNMFKDYRARCLDHSYGAGWAYLYPPETKGHPYLINLTTQLNTRGAQMSLVIASFNQLRLLVNASDSGIGPRIRSIALPQIGAGLGGLDWNLVKSVAIQNAFMHWSCDLYIYEKYVPGY